MGEVKSVFAVMGGVFGWFFGGMDSLLYLLVIFVAVDYITGLFSAFSQKIVSSSQGVKGIMKKVLIFLLVGIGNAVDMVLIPDGNPIRTAVIFFYLSNEGISILENAGGMGLPIPQRLKDVLAQLKEGNHDKN